MGKLLHTEKELVKKLKASDKSPFEVLFYKYRHKVNGFIVKMVPPQIRCLTLELYKDESLERLMKEIGLALKVNYQYENGKIVLMPK